MINKPRHKRQSSEEKEQSSSLLKAEEGYRA